MEGLLKTIVLVARLPGKQPPQSSPVQSLLLECLSPVRSHGFVS